MMWMVAVLVVLVLGGVAAVAAGRAGTWEEPERDRVATTLPEGRLTTADLRRVRFPLAVRGYRMRDVDALLDRLADQLPDGAPEPVSGAVTGRPAQDADGDTP